MNRTTSTMLAMLLGNSMMWATPTHNPDVTGYIVDENNQPLEFVNIALLSSNDSTYVQGATSDVDGKFHIVTPETGGILRITYVGYETRYVNVENIEAGRIILRSDAKMLDNVTVKGQLPKTKLTGNSMVTTIEGTVLGSSGSAKEMLSKVPGMTQKGDDLEVLGKGTPIYYINGRRMQDKDELKRLRSEEIQSVEVITNPGAEYDATVSAVVRIKTIRRQGDGFGYDLSASNSQDLGYGYTDPSATVNLRYRHNSLDLFGMVNYWKWDGLQDSRPLQSSWIKKGGELQNMLQNTILRHDWNGQGFNYNLGFNYQFSSNHSVGLRIEKHDKFDCGTEARIGTEMRRVFVGSDSPGVVEENGSYQKSREHHPYDLDGNAYYNGKVGKMGIDFNVDFMTSKSSEVNDIQEWNTKDRIGEPSSFLGQTQEAKSSLWATKLVFSYPVWKGQLLVGTEMSFVNRTNNYSISGYALPSTDSKVKEYNIARFVQYSCSIPKLGNVNAGLRFEHVGFEYIDHLNDGKSMSRYDNDVFPSISWSNQWGSFQTSLAYSMKTVRPNYKMLDESIIYINTFSFQQGNPQMKNAMMQEISANVRWKWLTLFMAYERRDNTHSMWSYIYNDDGVILVKNINLDTPVRNFAAFLSASPTFGVYSPNWTVGWQKFFYTLNLADPREATGQREVSFRKPLMFFDLNNAFRFKHSWQLEANMSITTKGDAMNYHLLAPSYNLRLVVQKCWLKNDALCLRASISDVLQRSGTNMQMDCGYYTLNQDNWNNNHRLEVTLRYTFNASNSKYKGSGAGKEAKSRMEK